MASTGVTRIEGVDPAVAIKAPCVVATTANITLSGAQTIDGVAVAETTVPTRVLVRAQTDSVNNGIYNVSGTAWVRSEDFDGNRDVVKGTLVSVAQGTIYAGTTFKVTTADPIVINTSAITFDAANAIDVITVVGTSGVDTYAKMQALSSGLFSPGDIIKCTGDGIFGDMKVKDGNVTGDGGILFPFDGNPTGRYVERVIIGSAFDSWFETVGNNSSDDTVNLQKLLTLNVKSISLTEGKTYKISGSLTNAISDRILFGNGATLNPTADIGGTDYCIENTASRFKVRDLKIAGVASTTLCGGLGFTTGDGCEVDSCSFFDLDNGGGIVASAGAVAHAFTNNYMYNCAPVSLGGQQYGAIHCNAPKSVISGNRLIFCGQTAISTANPIALVITSNYMDGQNNAASGGVILDAAGNSCVITGNIIKDMKVEGIQIANSLAGQATEDHTITGNTIISTRAANDGPVSGITIVASGTGTVERITISGNSIRADDRGVSSTVKLIDLDGCIDTTITGNTLEGGRVGIGFTSDSPGSVISGNTLRNQDATAISLSGGGNESLITGNRIKGDGSAGSTTAITFNAGIGGGFQKITGNFISDCLVGISGTFSGSERSFIDSNHFIRNGTNLSLTSNTVNSISNNTYNTVRSGTVTLVAGTFAVNPVSALKASDRIRLSVNTIGGTPGSLYVSTRSNGTSFTITSTSGSDTSTVDWELIG